MTGAGIARALAGGGLIGLSATLLLSSHGRTAGVSGIAGGIMNPSDRDLGFRLPFLAGLVVLGAIFALSRQTTGGVERPLTLAVSGLLVGVGTQLGGGCTSGHGVCGLSRPSLRSFVATLTFMAVAMVTTYLRLHVHGAP